MESKKSDIGSQYFFLFTASCGCVCVGFHGLLICGVEYCPKLLVILWTLVFVVFEF